MRRLVLSSVLAVAAATTAAASRPAAHARKEWPLRVTVSGVGRGAAAFRATTTDGAALAQPTLGLARQWWRPGGATAPFMPLAPGDTVATVAPAEFPMNLTRGTVVLSAAGPERIAVVVRSVHGGNGSAVAAQGRQLVLRQGPAGVTIESR